jgi:hypothetical protein
VSHPQRAALILNLLGEERLLTHEAVARFREKYPEWEGCLYDNSMGALLRRMWKERDLDRAGEPMSPGSSRMVYRYFIRRELEGPIADLDAAFREAEAGG